MAGGAHLVGIDVEYAVVMRGLIGKFLFDLIGKAVAVRLAGAPRHADPAEGIDAAL